MTAVMPSLARSTGSTMTSGRSLRSSSCPPDARGARDNIGDVEPRLRGGDRQAPPLSLEHVIETRVPCIQGVRRTVLPEH
jgi:hypothetical protein